MSDRSAAGITGDLSRDELARVEAAAKSEGYDDLDAFAREGALRYAADVLDEDDPIECLFDDCDETFATVRERRGHLGGSAHATAPPDGEFWCGYCGHGPLQYRGVQAHHGQVGHDGEVVHLDHEPDVDELLAPDERPDHMNPDLLERLYEAHDGAISEMCREHDFDVGRGRVRRYLIDFGIHEVTPHGPVEDGEGPEYRDPDWLEERYEAADGNVSEMHRRLEADGRDIPYRTLLKNLKANDIHDATDAPREPRRPRNAGNGQEAEGNRRDGDDELTETPDGEAVYVLEWGRWGPPMGGTYHLSEDCWVLNRSDSDREVVPLPWPRADVEDDGEWEVCGHCEPDDDQEADAGADPDPEPAPDPDPKPAPESAPEPEPQEDAPATEPVDSFAELDTPDWLDEGSFYKALEMATDVEELGAVLGWDEYDHLERCVERLGVSEDLEAVA